MARSKCWRKDNTTEEQVLKNIAQLFAQTSPDNANTLVSASHPYSDRPLTDLKWEYRPLKDITQQKEDTYNVLSFTSNMLFFYINVGLFKCYTLTTYFHFLSISWFLTN